MALKGTFETLGIYKNKRTINNLFFRLKVRDLLHAVGKKCGIDPVVIDSLDLENVVERTIAINVYKDI